MSISPFGSWREVSRFFFCTANLFMIQITLKNPPTWKREFGDKTNHQSSVFEVLFNKKQRELDHQLPEFAELNSCVSGGGFMVRELGLLYSSLKSNHFGGAQRAIGHFFFEKKKVTTKLKILKSQVDFETECLHFLRICCLLTYIFEKSNNSDRPTITNFNFFFYF